MADAARQDGRPDFTPAELREMPTDQLAGLVIACAIGCGDLTIARILKESAQRLRRLSREDSGR